MVSIIISSYQPDFINRIKKNIENTIGVQYEIIIIENNNIMGICQAYNSGANIAKYSFLCFIHEDIVFQTLNWANPLISKFDLDAETGVIGIAGAKYKSLSPSGWFTEKKTLDFINIIQHSGRKNDKTTLLINNDYEEVICLDGVFLFTKKDIWTRNKFDENTFKGFHCYDLDFSLNISSEKKVFVTNKVLLEHYSLGSYNKNWIDDSIKFHRKWKHLLPKGDLGLINQKNIEWKIKIDFLYRMLTYNYSLKNLLQVYLDYGFFKYFSVVKAIKCFKFLLISYLKNIV